MNIFYIGTGIGIGIYYNYKLIYLPCLFIISLLLNEHMEEEKKHQHLEMYILKIKII